jgi:hypothetical protein
MYRGGRAASQRSASPARARERGSDRRGRPRTAAQALLAAALLCLALRVLLRPSASPASRPEAPALLCYVGDSDEGGALATQPLPHGHVCSSYRLRCAPADVAGGVCTAAEVEERHTRHVHAIAAAAECDELAQAGAYHHGRYSEVTCCDDASLCNGGLGGASERAGGDAAGRVVRCAAGRNGGAITAVVPADGGRCVRYGAPCAEGESGCSAEDVAARRPRLVLGSASAEACAVWKTQPEAHVELLCCASDLCNDGRQGGFGAARAGAAGQGDGGAHVRRAGAERADGAT